MRYSSLITAVIILAACGCKFHDATTSQKPIRVTQDNQGAQPGQEILPEKINYTNVRNIEFVYDKEKYREYRNIEMWYSVDGGKNWLNQGKYDSNVGKILFLAVQDNEYRFSIVPLDRKGERIFTPNETTKPDYAVVVDTTPPVVEVLGPNGNEIFGSGAALTIRFLVNDAYLKPNSVSIEFSKDGGSSYSVLARDMPNTGTFFWDVPKSVASDRCIVKISAKDLAGNEEIDISDNRFSIDGYAPEVKITGPNVSTKSPTEILATVQDVGPAGVARIYLYYTRDDGKNWVEHKSFAASEKILFTELDGSYGLYAMATDNVGNAGVPPGAGTKPMAKLLIDSTAPVVAIISPRGGDSVPSGVEYAIQYSVKDNIELPLNSVSIDYSVNGGASWDEIAKQVENTGTYLWKVPPVGSKDCKIRVTAVDVVGNKTAAETDSFIVDTSIPRGVATGPNRSKSRTINVEYGISEAGYALVDSVELLYTADNGASWFRFGADPDKRTPFIFTVPDDGKYGVTVVATTAGGRKFGKCQKAPQPGELPQMTIDVDATPPDLSLETFNFGGFYRPGKVEDIVWRYTDKNPDAYGIFIYVSFDAGQNWQPIEQKLNPALTKFQWTIPPSVGKSAIMKIVAYDLFGNERSVPSQRPFIIDGDNPSMTIIGEMPDVTRSRTITVRYNASDATSGISTVEAWVRIEGETAYKKIAAETATYGEVQFTVPDDGKWELLMNAFDKVGNSYIDMTKNPGPAKKIMVDTKPPIVKVIPFTTKKSTIVGVNENYEVMWTATDNTSDEKKMKVRIEYSSDRGNTWNLAASQLSNGKAYDVSGVLEPDKYFIIKVIVYDEAGNAGEANSVEFNTNDLEKATIMVSGIRESEEVPVGTVRDIGVKTVGQVANMKLRVKAKGNYVEVMPVVEGANKFIISDEPEWYTIQVVAVDKIKRTIYSNEIAYRAALPAQPNIKFDIVGALEQRPETLTTFTYTLVSPDTKLQEVYLQMRVPSADWKSVAQFITTTIKVTLPAEEGVYGYRVMGKDKFGRATFSNDINVKVSLPEPPKVKMIVKFKEGSELEANSMEFILIEPEYVLKYCKEIWLQILDKEKWENYTKVEGTRVRFDVPGRLGENKVRVWGKDIKDREFASDEAVSFVVVPFKSIVFMAPSKSQYLPGDDVLCQAMRSPTDFDASKIYSVEIQEAGVWRAADGAQVKLNGVIFKAPFKEGVYRLRCKYKYHDVDHVTQESTFAVVPAPRDPMISMESKPVAMGGGDTVPITLKVKDIPPEDIGFELSDQSGAVNSWKGLDGGEIKFQQQIKKEGYVLAIYRFNVPKVEGSRFRMRASWKDRVSGRVTFDDTKADFSIESTNFRIDASNIQNVMKGDIVVEVPYKAESTTAKVDVQVVAVEPGKPVEILKNVAQGLAASGTVKVQLPKITRKNVAIRFIWRDGTAVTTKDSVTFAIDSDYPEIQEEE